jgi:hypothetical protein
LQGTERDEQLAARRRVDGVLVQQVDVVPGRFQDVHPQRSAELAGDGFERQPPSCWADPVAGKKLIRKPRGQSCHVGKLLKEPAGGPLIDNWGTLIGSGSGSSDGKGYYTHLDEIYRFLKASEAGLVLLDSKD